MNAVVRSIERCEYKSVHDLLMAHGWAHRVQDYAKFSELLDNSDIVLIAIKENQIVGFVRAITDSISNGYISMLIVDPAFRKQGIGKNLILALIDSAQPSVTWALRAGRAGASEFFAAIGFRISSEAMELKRRSE
jgi:ribosomal protein S18 acetylase RimI-like enzyme